MNRVDIAATSLLIAGLITSALYSISFGGIRSEDTIFQKYECRNMSTPRYAVFKVAECHLRQR